MDIIKGYKLVRVQYEPTFWPGRLVVRILGFQPKEQSSILCRATKFSTEEKAHLQMHNERGDVIASN